MTYDEVSLALDNLKEFFTGYPGSVAKEGKKPVIVFHGSLRLSLSKFNTMEEAEKFISTIGPIVENLRKMSPLSEGVSYNVATVH